MKFDDLSVFVFEHIVKNLKIEKKENLNIQY